MEPEIPLENSPNRSDDLTVGELRKLIDKLPDDYRVSFDSALGRVVLGDFTIYHDYKKISING